MTDSLNLNVEELFKCLDPALFLNGTDSQAQVSNKRSHEPIRTYIDKSGLTLSAISDRQFMAWIVASVMPLEGRRILEIGSGTGYLAYALAQLAGENGSVEGCEILPELCEAALNNPLVKSMRSIKLHAGDFVEVVPNLGTFDVVIATSSMARIHPAILGACKLDGGLIGLPIEIQGGGDCYTLFRRQGASLEVIDSMLSVSVPTTGCYSSFPPWLVPVDQLLPEFEPSEVVCLSRERQAGHPIYGTLALRSFLQAREPLFAAVSVTSDEAESFEQRAAFGLVDIKTRSFCLQRASQLLLYGPRALSLAERFVLQVQTWQADGSPSLANFRYRLACTGINGISISPDMLGRTSDWHRI